MVFACCVDPDDFQLEQIEIDGHLYKWLSRPDTNSAIVKHIHKDHPVSNFLAMLNNTEKMKHAFQKSYYGLHNYPTLSKKIRQLVLNYSDFHTQSLVELRQIVPQIKDVLQQLEDTCLFMKLNERAAANRSLSSVLKKIQPMVNKSRALTNDYRKISAALKESELEVLLKKNELHDNETLIRKQKKDLEETLGSVNTEALQEIVTMFWNSTGNAENSQQAFSQGYFAFLYKLYDALKSPEQQQRYTNSTEGDENFKKYVEKFRKNPELVAYVGQLRANDTQHSALEHAIRIMEYVLDGMHVVATGIDDSVTFFEILKKDIVSLQEDIETEFDIALEMIAERKGVFVAGVNFDPFKRKVVTFYSRLIALRSIVKKSAKIFGLSREMVLTWLDEKDPGQPVPLTARELIDFVESVPLLKITHDRGEGLKETKDKETRKKTKQTNVPK